LSYSSHADYIAAQKARTKAQCDAILDLLADGAEDAASDIPIGLQRSQAWQTVAKPKLYRTVLDRLDMLREQGRTVDRYVPGRRGSRIRMVRRA
jgi:hypothetical protein